MFSDELENPFKTEKEEFGAGYSISVYNGHLAVIGGAKRLVSVAQEEVVLEVKKHKFARVLGAELTILEIADRFIKIEGDITAVEFEVKK